jgi:hypothetical protein
MRSWRTRRGSWRIRPLLPSPWQADNSFFFFFSPGFIIFCGEKKNASLDSSTAVSVCAHLPRSHGFGLAAMVRYRLRMGELQRMKLTTPREYVRMWVREMRDRMSNG